MIVLRTSEELCLDVLNRWKKQYPDCERLLLDGKRVGDTEEKLTALGSNPKPEDVNKIIGNDSWTTQSCFICDERAKVWIEFNPEWGQEAKTLCPTCVLRAFTLLKQFGVINVTEGTSPQA